MTHRVFNFNPGPATLPLPVLEEIRDEMLDFRGTGMSILELSHRSAEYLALHEETKGLLRELLGLGEQFEIVFVGGGASTQFFHLPMCFLAHGRKKADYVVTGTWSKKAVKEAKRFGEVHVAYSAANEEGQFLHIPRQDQLNLSSDAVYLHFTSNNTIAGTQWQTFPTAPEGAFLVADMSSDMMWRPFDPNPFGLIYAGVQKNLGPAGVTLVIVRKDMLEHIGPDLPTMVDYRTHVSKDSAFNTLPVFPIYVVGKVLKWIKDIGGLQEVERRNRLKAERLYGMLDAHAAFYRAPVAVDSRSAMNVVWRLPSEELEKTFVSEAKKAGLVGLKGHRDVGGIRASLYNAMSVEGVSALIAFMEAFVKKHG